MKLTGWSPVRLAYTSVQYAVNVCNMNNDFIVLNKQLFITKSKQVLQTTFSFINSLIIS